MPRSSDSLPSASLPFGADSHIHATLRRTGSVPRSVQREYRPAAYYRGPQTYSALIADAQASNAVPRLPNAYIRPSSIKSIPRSHKKVLRQHGRLFWVVFVIFLISLIGLTVAIVLGALTAHQHGQNDVKCAAIIVGVFGFSGAVGSAAVIWLIWTGWKERARLEKRWADDKRVKDARSIKERQTESHIREGIRDREWSLSRSCSRGRHRNRINKSEVAGNPSSIPMRPTPTSSARKANHNAQPMSRRAPSPWPSPLGVSNDADDEIDDAAYEEKDKENNSRNDGSYDDEKHGGHDEACKAQAMPRKKKSASMSFLNLDPSDSEKEDDSKSETVNQPDIAIQEQQTLSKVCLPFGEFESFPAFPESVHTSPAPLDTSFTKTNTSPTDPHPKSPVPHNPPRLPPIEQTPFSTGIVGSSDLSTSNAQRHSDTPPNIPGWKNGGLGSAQSDANFQAMLDLADDVGSEDERDREIRRRKIQERVEAWANTAADGGEREERGRRLREAVERGLLRMATRKKERRKDAVVGARAGVGG